MSLQRAGRTLALAASVAAILSWSLIVYRHLRTEEEANLGLVAVATLMVLVSVVGGTVAWFALYQIMYAVFLLEFVPVGFYLLGTPVGVWVGVANLVYVVGAAQTHVGALVERKKAGTRKG